MGIGLGVGISLALNHVIPWLIESPFMKSFIDVRINVETQVTLWSIIVSFMVAAMVGLAFGIYPAMVASRQDPIVALRHD
jgi:putative ABC transport system permease protein